MKSKYNMRMYNFLCDRREYNAFSKWPAILFGLATLVIVIKLNKLNVNINYVVLFRKQIYLYTGQ